MTFTRYYTERIQEQPTYIFFQKYIRRTIQVDCMTLSALVDEILRNYSKLAKSFVKDTTHFLNLIKSIKIDDAHLLGTVDVTALEGIERCIKFLKKHNASDSEIILVQKFLPHILKKNYFQFNNETYLQSSGTTM